MTQEAIRVLLVDDQPLLRTGLATILSTEPGLEVVGEASDGREALAQVELLDPDVVCMDVQMPHMDGIEATKALTAFEARAAILILTTFDRDDFLFETLRAGASGFLLKTAGPEELIHAIQVLAGGESLLAPEVTGRVLDRMFTESAVEPAVVSPPVPEFAVPLTRREDEILSMLVKGKSNAAIAKELFVGPATVKTHVSNILMKLDVKDRIHAVIWAYEHGYVNSTR
ncbi:response regulator [Enteractinococcus coprophilus]|uniref:LuxR family two component transcriptional regulator n=1 Tax=Enteractinococcus coprophilus TaxID=1027633 RepID=A0A543AG11_9MICC|nr:response regulator transcription factor [Enteractinococcus coprophilus]TQL71519.1 LuxR family two component transcriptional regulator [Enteractinococcus coprophilus]